RAVVASASRHDRGRRGAGRRRAQFGHPLDTGDRPVTVSIAVIGAGFMGTNHARVLSSLPGARLAAIVDIDAAKARAAAAGFGPVPPPPTTKEPGGAV